MHRPRASIVRDNLIGTDSSGTADLGNAQDGIQIDNASGTTIEGDNLGVQVISGNLVGIEIDGPTSTQNLIAGQLDRHRQVGHGRPGQLERGDPDRRRLRQHGGRNDVGRPQRDLGQSVGNPDRRCHGHRQPDRRELRRHRYQAATPPWATRSTASSSATTRRTTRSAAPAEDRETRSPTTSQAGVLVQSGTGDSILSNSMVFNGQQGIALANGNDLQSCSRRSPARAAAEPEATSQGSLSSWQTRAF